MKATKPRQLPLLGPAFGFTPADLTAIEAAADARLTGLTWSHSRRSTLEQCPLRYYYEYYGANMRTAKGEPAKETLHFLKKVENRHERAGSLLHLAIGYYFRQARRGERPDVERLVAWARTIFANDRAHSRAHPEGGPAGAPAQHPPVLLREYHYALPDADALCDEADARLAAALRSFATDNCFAAFRAGGVAPDALVEAAIKLSGLPCAVGGRLDLAYRGDGQVTVVDWKLGAGDGGGDDSLQLAVYGLWAVEYFGCRPEDLRVCKAFLGSGEVAEFRVAATILAAARARIVQDVERMAAVIRYGRDAIAAAFTPCAHPAVCGLCAFQRVCPEGRKLADA